MADLRYLSDGQRRELRRIADGRWYPASRTGREGTVLSTVAAMLWRMDCVERKGASRTASPRNPGFQYRVTPKGLKALADAEG